MTSSPKTAPSGDDVSEFLNSVDNERRQADAQVVLDLMRQITKVEPVMWGSSIIGFGTQPYTTADGKNHEWFAVGLSPRKAALTLYGLTYYGTNDDLLEQLGKHTTGKGCLYIKRLSDIDLDVLRTLISRSWKTNSAQA